MKFETQEALLALGYAIGEIDGLIGPATRKAIRTFQTSAGLRVTGKASHQLVDAMQTAARDRGLARPAH